MKAERQRQWLAHIEQAEQQGLSLAQYARLHQLNPQTLYAARSTAKVKRSSPSSSAFVAVSARAPSRVVVRLPGGIVIECDITDIAQVLQQVVSSSCLA